MSGLPGFLEYSSFPGPDAAVQWTAFFNALYQEFCTGLLRGNLTFNGLPVRCERHPEFDGKHKGFWHLTHEGPDEPTRTPDFNRCRRLKWIRWVIMNATDPSIRVFQQAPRGASVSWVLWLYREDYAVILHERNGYYMLKTAFVLKPHKKRELERDWNAYQKKLGPPP